MAGLFFSSCALPFSGAISLGLESSTCSQVGWAESVLCGILMMLWVQVIAGFGVNSSGIGSSLARSPHSIELVTSRLYGVE